MAVVSMFGWKNQVEATAAELVNGEVTFDGAKHMKSLQRLGHQLLQELQEAKPQLAGQDELLFRRVADQIGAIKQAAFYRSDSIETAISHLGALVRDLINAKPVTADMEPLRNANPYTRGLLLTAERNKSIGLLSIQDFEVKPVQGNKWSTASNGFALEAVEKNADLGKLLDYVHAMHFAVVEMFLGHFAADHPEEVDDISAAVSMAAALHKQAEVRQAVAA